MMMKSFTAGIVGSALLASAAFAQSAQTTPTTPSANPSTTTSGAASTSYTGNWRTSKVVGLSVYNDGGESLGSINDLLTDKSGKIVAAVVGVGGFLGVGERYVAIPFEKVKFVNEPVKTAASTSPASGGATTSSTSSSTTGAAGGGMAAPATPATTATTTPNPWYPDHAVISGTKDELKAMTEFKYTNS